MYLFPLQNILQVYRDIKSLKFLEKSVGFKQPHIIALTTNEKVNLLEIVGDGTIINVSEVDVPYAIILLMCSYYVFDLAYPRRFCQTLGFFQHKVLDEEFLDTNSSGFINFLHKIEKCEKKRLSRSRDIVTDMYKDAYCMPSWMYCIGYRSKLVNISGQTYCHFVMTIMYILSMFH